MAKLTLFALLTRILAQSLLTGAFCTAVEAYDLNDRSHPRIGCIGARSTLPGKRSALHRLGDLHDDIVQYTGGVLDPVGGI